MRLAKTLPTLLVLLTSSGLIASVSKTLNYGTTSSFLVNYGGGQNFPTIVSSNVLFTPSSWTTASGITSFNLRMTVTNTSSFGSAATGMGFLTTPNPYVAATKKSPATGDPNFSVQILDSNNANGTTDELFTKINYNGTLPQLGGSNNVDFCVFQQSNCAGAGNGAGPVQVGAPRTSLIKISYTTATPNDQFSFDNFYMRYQGICASATDRSCGGSDVGTGIKITDIPDDVVPEPSFYGMMGLGMSGLIFAAYRKRAAASTETPTE